MMQIKEMQEDMPMTATYDEIFSGRLSGILQWPQFEAVWAALAARPQGWYVRDFKNRELPDAPMPQEEFVVFLKTTEEFLRKRHREDYCGFLYVDDRENPSFLKVFDPRKMGSACGCGGAVTPRWTISSMRPQPVAEERHGLAGQAQKRANLPFLRHLFGAK